MFCENCGANISEDAKFCSSCGNKVSNFSNNSLLDIIIDINQNNVDSEGKHIWKKDEITDELVGLIENAIGGQLEAVFIDEHGNGDLLGDKLGSLWGWSSVLTSNGFYVLLSNSHGIDLRPSKSQGWNGEFQLPEDNDVECNFWWGDTETAMYGLRFVLLGSSSTYQERVERLNALVEEKTKHSEVEQSLADGGASVPKEESLVSTFEFHKGGKLQDELEGFANEWISSSVSEYYSKLDPSELDSLSVKQIVAWYLENCGSGGYYENDWYIESSFRTLLNDWFSENNETLMDDAWMNDKSLIQGLDATFEFLKGGKLQDQLEQMANGFVNEAVLDFYGEQEIESLSVSSIKDLLLWYKSNCETGYYENDWYVEVSFRTLINEWHEAHEEDPPL